MSTITTSATRASVTTELPVPSNQNRAAYARQATFKAFGQRARWALDEPDFADRAPDDAPRPIGPIAAKVVEDVGRRALAHWLNQAAKAETDEEREAALEIARNIARMAGVPHADLIGRGAT